MNYKIIVTNSYSKKLKKFLKKHPHTFERYAKAIEILEINPYHPSLRFHKLRGRLSEFHSIFITMKYRVIIDIGSHDDGY